MEKQALEYIRNAGGSPQIEWFDDDHEPIGPQLREGLLKKNLVREYEDGFGDDRIELTEAGRLAIS